MTHSDPRDDFDDRPPEKRAKPASVSPVPASPWRVAIPVGVILGLLIVCMGGMILNTHGMKDAAYRIQSANNLKQIGMAVHSYNDTFDELPHNSYAPDGKPLLSWRVHLLPFVEQDNLYRQFRLDEPWDGPNNRHLLSIKPRIYGNPRSYAGPLTYYRGFSSPGAIFERRSGDTLFPWFFLTGRLAFTRTQFKMADVKDGFANTILVVEAGDPVEWTKPEDLDASPGKPFPKMGGLRGRKDFQAVMGDGSIRRLPHDTPEEKLRALVTYSGGESVTAE